MKKSLLNTSISLININAENCFQISLETTNTNQIIVSATIDGEYQKDLALQIKEEGPTVFVSAGFNPNFKNPNDKLSAHKVVSISLHIKLPANKNINLYGKSSNINVTGNYKQLDVSLYDGFCKLRNIGGIITVKTQNGNIFLENKNATIKATSKYGEIYNTKIPKGKGIFNLLTITGNIHITKTK